MSNALPNYLLTHRKRSGLSQDEVAFLLGTASGTKVSRYETGARAVNLETALALQVVYGRAASDLFAGLFEEVEGSVLIQVKRLRATVQLEPDDVTRSRKLLALEAILQRHT